MALPDKIQQLDERVAAAVRGAVQSLRQEIEERLRGLESELDRPLLAAGDLQPLADEAAASGRRDALAGLRRALAAIDRARSQSEVLAALLEASARFASRSALFLTRSDAARGWASFGFSDSEQAIAEVSFAYGSGSPWSRLAEGGGPVDLTAAECAQLSSRLESQVPRQAVLVPLLLEGRLAAALYADQVSDGGILEVDALQSLAYAASLALETLPLRAGAATPTLAAAGEATARPLAFWEPGETAAAAPAAVEEVPEEEAEEPQEEVLAAFEAVEVEEEEETEPDREEPEAAREEAEVEGAEALPEEAEEPLPESETLPEAEPSLDAVAGEEDLPTWEQPTQELIKEASVASAAAEEALEVAPPPAQEPEETPAAWTVKLEAPTGSAEEETAAIEEAPAGEGGAETELMDRSGEPASGSAIEELPPPVAEAPGADLPVEALPQIEEDYEPPRPAERPEAAPPPAMQLPDRDVSEDETVLLRRSPPEPEPEPPSAAAGEAAAEGRKPGAAEVQPPGDFTGPGLAFGGARAGGDDTALHEEGRRLARLLVSEIRLYNEEEVEEGKRNHDLYSRLKEEIDRSRKMYEERVDDQVRASRDYFSEELVRILADGDPTVLGTGYDAH